MCVCVYVWVCTVGVFAGCFGLGSGKKAEGDLTAADISDSFKGFSFTKEDDNLTEASKTSNSVNNSDTTTTPIRTITVVNRIWSE